MEYICFKAPFCATVSGPSGSGKTQFVKNVIMNADKLIEPVPEKIIYCYSEWQKTFEGLPCEFIEGIPDLDVLKADKTSSRLLILDDLLTTVKGKEMDILFCQGSHHWNLNIMFLTQNAFYANMRTARVNSQYLVLLKNVSDKLQISNLGKQMFPGKQTYFMDAYNDATAKPYSYLLIDLHPTTPDEIRLRSNIFNDPVVYLYK
jgi:IVa2 protein